jgi:transposase
MLCQPENFSQEDQHTIDLVLPAHDQVTLACALAQVFARIIRSRNLSALEPWLGEAAHSGVPELRSFAAGIRRGSLGLSTEDVGESKPCLPYPKRR